MREVFLRRQWEEAGAGFRERVGVEVPAAVSGEEAEYRLVRDSAGLTDFSHMRAYRIPEENAIDFLDALVAGNVARTRFGRVLHTFLADPEGMLVADCYVANNDEEFVLLCESLVDDSELGAIFAAAGAAEAGLEPLTDTHVVLGVDGFRAWEVARKICGADVVGIPYLGIEMYPFEQDTIRLIRAGKTSEFGYLFVVPHGSARRFFERVRSELQGVEGGLCGVDVHDCLRLEGRFFNIFAEGARVRDPLALGLQWMIDFDKEAYVGREPILARRSGGITRKIVGVRSDETIPVGASIFHGAEAVAEVVASCRSYALNAGVALALFPTELAFSGLDFSLGDSEGSKATTISMPPIQPRSLTVKLDEM
jgi:aminomethyltransferase